MSSYRVLFAQLTPSWACSQAANGKHALELGTCWLRQANTNKLTAKINICDNIMKAKLNKKVQIIKLGLKPFKLLPLLRCVGASRQVYNISAYCAPHNIREIFSSLGVCRPYARNNMIFIIRLMSLGFLRGIFSHVYKRQSRPVNVYPNRETPIALPIPFHFLARCLVGKT